MVAASSYASDAAIPRSETDRLRTWNLIVGLIHLIQAGIMFALSNDFSLPVNLAFLAGPPGTDPSIVHGFDLPLGPLVAVFLLLAAVDHLLCASPVLNGAYNRLLARKRNDIRWIEYSVSASLMIVLIAMITGVNDLGALIAIAGVNACMLFFGLMQEHVSSPGDAQVNWMPFIYGSFAGAVPWIVITLQILTAIDQGSSVPGFVYGIMISLFILFNSFAINMVLQYKQVGKWRDYLFGEKVYLGLSLAAKTALAWQVFANVLV
ncbi:MAG: heliorhodopsin HeR [Chloroflexota bacterium]|nr:heliorhodopsin HeR [Chloroflexota bacterium]